MSKIEKEVGEINDALTILLSGAALALRRTPILDIGARQNLLEMQAAIYRAAIATHTILGSLAPCNPPQP